MVLPLGALPIVEDRRSGEGKKGRRDVFFWGFVIFFWGGRDWIVFVRVLIPSGLNVTAGGKDVFVVNVFL